MKSPWSVMVVIGCVALFRVDAKPANTANAAVAEMVRAATNFLSSLDTAQRSKTQFEWPSEERFNWHFIPKDRAGLPLKEMNAAQKPLALALLSSGLSHRGYLKASTIISLEQVLQEIEGPARRIPRDPELYHVSIFGQPIPGGTWGWRVEGHHLSINFTIVRGEIVAATPSFLGSNPGEVRSGPRSGLRVLGAEEDLGRQLIKSLTPEQRKVALIDVKAPDDILTGASRRASLSNSVGLTLRKMDRQQRAIASSLIREYIERVRPEFAASDMEKIEKAGLQKIYFAWAGGLEKGERHYYRLHGPTFLLEYDNTQNDANHVHAVWRDFENDFGLDLLGEHYLRSGHHQAR